MNSNSGKHDVFKLEDTFHGRYSENQKDAAADQMRCAAVPTTHMPVVRSFTCKLTSAGQRAVRPRCSQGAEVALARDLSAGCTAVQKPFLRSLYHRQAASL